MPKFACAAWGFREMTLPEYFAACNKLGLEFVEVNLSDGTPKHLTPDATEDDIKQMLSQAEDAGVKVVALAGGNNFAAEDVAAEIEKVKGQIDLAATAGAEVLRVFAGWVGASGYTDATFAQISDALQQVGEHAEDAGVLVAMENHGGVTATGAQCLRLLEPVSRPEWYVLLKPGQTVTGKRDLFCTLPSGRHWVFLTVPGGGSELRPGQLPARGRGCDVRADGHHRPDQLQPLEGRALRGR